MNHCEAHMMVASKVLLQKNSEWQLSKGVFPDKTQNDNGISLHVPALKVCLFTNNYKFLVSVNKY